MTHQLQLSAFGSLAAFRCASVWLVGYGGLSCVVVDESEPWPVTGTLESFRLQAQPVLARRCATPGCHGNGERSLAIYAETYYRRDLADLSNGSPLDDNELWQNYVQVSAFVVGAKRAEDSLLLSKALAKDAGGIGHLVTQAFTSREDPDYVELQQWLELALR
jgi:hypothetical protein